MGLLSKGTPLDWDDAKTHADHVRKHGIEQFLAIYHRLRDRRNDNLLWGDEVCPRPRPSVGVLLMHSGARGAGGVYAGAV
jgi:hypothetical protein